GSEDRRFLHLQADVKRDAYQDDGNQERYPPTPRRECILAHPGLSYEDYYKRDKQAQCCRDLNETRVKAALSIGYVFRDVNCRTAVLAAQRQALQDPNGQQGDWSKPARGGVGGEKTNESRGSAHNG